MKLAIARSAATVLLSFSLSGCAQTAVFSPPPNGEQVTVTVKVPKDLAADTMHVMYRSAKCPSKESADGVPYEIDGFYPIDVEPRQVGQSDLYEAKLARDGGGACQWKLSNVTFGVHYENTAQFGLDAEYAWGGGVIVIFDDNLPQRRSMERITEQSGDITIEKEYYPWVSESFLGGYKKRIIILGRQDVFSYKSINAKTITFKPTFHSNKTLYSQGPKTKNKDEIPQYTYPNGDTIKTRSGPSFIKMSN
ncbi:MAG: hypothetical protein CTR55_03020 [Pseudomonas sp.]|uniref:hypothetical protein n=1 Tax=Pseudomonas sp. TaxID=306 RepID=UPI000CBC4244|nr:hypothetical protein [Pseudomonas sp.]PJI50756.1 MAG: hypothetical protein CTR55_03020 [Pseudomonas sp.]